MTPTKPTHRRRRVFAALTLPALGALLAAALWAPSASADLSDYGLVSVSGSETSSQAGAHPDLTVGFAVKLDSEGFPFAKTETVKTDLPAGLIGNPQGYPQCPMAEFGALTSGFGGGAGGECPQDSQVGIVKFSEAAFNATVDEPLYSLEAPANSDIVARFGFIGVIYPFVIDFRLRPGDHGITATLDSSGQAFVMSAYVTTWGVPSDPSHDGQRMTFQDVINCGGPCNGPSPSGVQPTAFLSNPTSCSGPLQVNIAASSFAAPNTFDSQSAELPGMTGCDQVPFNPSVSLQPTSTEADSPTGLDVNLSVPQPGLTDPNGRATSHVKKTVVTLPQGMALNPSSADGLEGCTEAQIGLVNDNPIEFDGVDPTCPPASKLGTVEVTTPVLPDPIQGSFYLADPNDNPFNALLAGYIVAQGQGVLVKLPGLFERDPATGQITGTFDNNPQLPFSEFDLHFKGGSRGVLVNPPKCGTYQAQSELSPWSANDPDNPSPAETKSLTQSFQITSGPNGGPCPDLTDPARFTPSFSAGTVSPIAGQYSPFVLKVSRPDGQQSLKKIGATLPLGLSANLSGIPKCPQAQITPGVGGAANCAAASIVGRVNVGSGAGPTPFFLKDQPVYLTEGYGGAPLGLAIDTHAVAGPIDLGHVVVRSKLNVDPKTAQVSADAESLPNIIQGIPLHIRSVTLKMDRSAFTLNPTNCNPMAVTGQITGGGEDFADPADDVTVPVSDHFQVAGCGALGFSPQLSATILNGKDGVHRSDHPNLQFDLKGTPGDANIAAVSVQLPDAFQIDQNNILNICSESQLAATQCAGKGAIGTASASTPLLDAPLQGPVYAVSGSGGLPRLALILNGPPTTPINLLLRGDTTTAPSGTGGTSLVNTFASAPDAPVDSLRLTLDGGPGGYLVNNRNLAKPAKHCKASQKRKRSKKRSKKQAGTQLAAQATFTAQNGDTLSQSIPIATACIKKKGKHGKKH